MQAYRKRLDSLTVRLSNPIIYVQRICPSPNKGPMWRDRLLALLYFVFGKANVGLIHGLVQDLLSCSLIGVICYRVAPLLIALSGGPGTFVAFAHVAVVGMTVVAFVVKAVIRIFRWIRR